ncbi:MAG: toll/interleukin-1 receptor domain-containing protein [Cryomorphaceae bacterium]|nr:toll/interleukin-1 receptor domain-containing protein [Cryomorphaceae bacterium]
MKAFVSYSFRDSELYIITLLFEQLRKSGYIVETTAFNYSNLNFSNSLKIQSSDIFIGIITNDSNSINHVINEWNIAKQKNINNILIIEDGVDVQYPSSINFIRFNRQSPTSAINQLFNINTQSRRPAKSIHSNIEDALVAGGIIVGIAALITLLAGGKK